MVGRSFMKVIRTTIIVITWIWTWPSFSLGFTPISISSLSLNLSFQKNFQFDSTKSQSSQTCHSIWDKQSLFHPANPKTGIYRNKLHSSTQLMGIPKMFRWLTDQYPSVNRQLNDGLNHNTVVDYFYLDMNGIIHPCTHGNSETLIILNETEMFKKIFGYVDRLYRLVQPREVLYLAVDGVAPRAKMNQQRSRRFRSAKDAEQMMVDHVAQHGTLSESTTKFDSNCITPGTDFMLKLGYALNKWIQFKQETDPFWRDGAKVILSGPDVPGEGEHKVMDYIRELQLEQKEISEDSSHITNKRHVLYGLDADLIMLGLVTHEPKFALLREKMSVVMAGRGKGRWSKKKKKDMLEYNRNDFELLDLSLLTQMFKTQFRKFADKETGLKVPYDNNRIIDDFVFMCMFVGNDFIPHIPSLEIDNGALTLMLSTYIDLLPEWGGYLTDQEKISMARLEQFLHRLGFFEEEHFQRRGHEENEPGWGLRTDRKEFYGTYYQDSKTYQSTPKEAVLSSTIIGKHETNSISNRLEQPPDIDPNDIKSYRDFYYATKMGYDPKSSALARRQTARDYMEGLHWVLHYYHKGCGAWNWFYPHLYAPLVTDMVNLEEFYPDQKDEEFQSFPIHLGTPFPPLGQLLSVLPPQSASLLPKPLGELMTHPSSPIAAFYPPDFETDANGKRQSWEAVVKVPFINSEVLLDVANSIIDSGAPTTNDLLNETINDEIESKNNVDSLEGKTLLTNAERKRNVRGKAHTYAPPNFGDGAKILARERIERQAARDASGGKYANRSGKNARSQGRKTGR